MNNAILTVMKEKSTERTRDLHFRLQTCRKICGLGCVTRALARAPFTQPSPHILLKPTIRYRFCNIRTRGTANMSASLAFADLYSVAFWPRLRCTQYRCHRAINCISNWPIAASLPIFSHRICSAHSHLLHYSLIHIHGISANRQSANARAALRSA